MKISEAIKKDKEYMRRYRRQERFNTFGVFLAVALVSMSLLLVVGLSGGLNDLFDNPQNYDITKLFN